MVQMVVAMRDEIPQPYDLPPRDLRFLLEDAARKPVDDLAHLLETHAYGVEQRVVCQVGRAPNIVPDLVDCFNSLDSAGPRPHSRLS